jgi:hypothetical protein
MSTDITSNGIEVEELDGETEPTRVLEPEWPAAQKASPFEDYARAQAQARELVVHRSDSARWLDKHLLAIVAAAVSLPALRLPGAWLLLCAAVTVFMLGVDAMRNNAQEKGSADVVVVPARFAGRLAVGAVNPLNWLKVLFGALLALAAGAAVGALLGTARWFVDNGTDGIFAAARMGAWNHAPSIGAVFGCFFLLFGFGRTRDRRAVVLRRGFRQLPEAAMAGVTVCLVIVCATFALAGPRVGAGLFEGDDGLAWVPPGLRTQVDGLRDDIVTSELNDVAKCLSGKQTNLWVGHYTLANSLTEPDVARLIYDAPQPLDEPAIATAALAAQNQLAPWVEEIEIASGDQVVFRIDRSGIPTDAPLTDAAGLQAHADGQPAWLATVGPQVNSATVLDCSSRTPF